jgi:outer membrane lipoprotein-sorting protein
VDLKILAVLTYLLGIQLSGCAATRTLDPLAAQADFIRAWQADQHVVWEIDWPAAPVGGPVTVETWRAGGRYRFEILEAAAPALVGETLVFDGLDGWSYNRFAPALPLKSLPPSLAPVTDAFNLISEFSAIRPEKASQRPVRLDHGPARQITLTLTPGSAGGQRSLTWWRDDETGLPARIHFTFGEQEAVLQARSVELLPDPPAGLFSPAVHMPAAAR